MNKCSCGAELKEGVKFCPDCGKEVESKAADLVSTVKGAVQDGIKEFRTEVTGKIDEFGKNLSELDDRVKKIEALPLGKGPAIKTSSDTYKGYKLGKQLVSAREMAAKSPHLFNVLGDDQKADEFAKFLIAFVRVKKFGDMSAMEDIVAFQKTEQLQEGTTSEGGYLVPDEFAWDIVQLARNASFGLQNCTVLPMNSDQMYLPSELTAAAVAWTAEEGTITAGEPTFGQVSLTAKRLDGYARVTNELLVDSGIDIAGLLTEQFSYAIAQELDNQILNGTGDPVSGVLTSAVGTDVKLSAGNTNFSAVSADDLSTAIYSLESGYLNGARFIVNRIGLHYIRTLKDDNNRPIFAEIGGKVPSTIYEYPYFMSEQITNTSAAETAYMAFGNFKYFYLGRRNGSMSLDIDPYGLFTSYATRFRMVTRWGLAIGNANAFARVLTATT